MKDELKAIVQYTGKYNLHHILMVGLPFDENFPAFRRKYFNPAN